MNIKKNAVKDSFIPRKQNANKSDFGHVLVIAGSRNMSGAAILCANACCRSGAGLTTLAVPASIQTVVAAKTFPEIMTLPLAETAGAIRSSAVKEVLGYAERRKIRTLAIGPGLTVNPETSKFVKKIISVFTGNIVLDADGLNSIEEKDLSHSPAQITVTPHPGEFRRITGTASDYQKDAFYFAKRNRVVCVLKGSGTIVTDGSTTLRNATGNPGMATGGSGDVLTGMIAAFTSQTKSALWAAAAAVYLHGLAGDISAQEKTMVSMLPSDIIENIPAALKKTGIK